MLQDGRITAINIPELTRRRSERGEVVYSPATIPPEEYALMIKEHKEPIVNLIAPRLEKDALLRRVRKVLVDYLVPNLILVGRERKEDKLPGPDVVQALSFVRGMKTPTTALGGICIFSRSSSGTDEGGASLGKISEAERVWNKASAGCDFVTGQITFESGPVIRFLREYQELCDRSGTKPVAVFVSFTTVPTEGILRLLESLDVVVPPNVRRRLVHSGAMGKESVKIVSEVFSEVVEGAEREGARVPLGLQVEQVGVNSGELSLELLDSVHPILKGA